jgi:imidazolonepropionase-like amidohydrolase
MKNKLLIAFFFFGISGSIIAQTVIKNVTILDVEKLKLKSEQTVIINNGSITAIQKSTNEKFPDNAVIIDGKGKYLMPGLVDAHIHFFQNGGLYTRPDAIDLRKFKDYNEEITYARDDMENKLKRYLQNGITTVIDVGANEYFLAKRNEFKNKTYSPAIFMTGPLLTTYEPKVFEGLGENEPFVLTKTIEDGVKGVQEQLKFNPDFIKIWYIAGADGLSVEESARKNLPIVKAIINEAHNNSLKVAVHATQKITAQLAVENGADFLVHSIDDEVIGKDFVRLMQKNNTILCPTLIVHRGYLDTFGQRLNFTDHELRTADPYQLGTLLDLKHLPDTTFVNNYKNYANSKQSTDDLRRTDSISMANLKILSDAGITIATGTDAGNIGTLHVSSYLEELKAMQRSGMGNWEIIQASTINGAKVLDKTSEFGSIGAGKKANLILLDANPVENLENMTRINTIFNRGEIFKPDELIQDSPEDLAQRQLNAYNLRQIDAFLEPYAEDVEVYTFPDNLLYKGKETMRTQYSAMFDNVTNLHCELKERIVQGNIVIDKERVQFREQIVEAVAIYHIENHKIKRVYFIQ